MILHLQTTPVEGTRGARGRRQLLHSAEAPTQHAYTSTVIFRWQAEESKLKIAWLAALMLIVLKLNPSSATSGAAGGGRPADTAADYPRLLRSLEGDESGSGSGSGGHAPHDGDGHSQCDDDDELSKLVSSSAALSSFSGKDSLNLELIGGGQPFHSQESFESDPASGLIVANQQQQQPKEVKEQTSGQQQQQQHQQHEHQESQAGDKKGTHNTRPSFIRAEFGDHAEPSEIDHQSAPMNNQTAPNNVSHVGNQRGTPIHNHKYELADSSSKNESSSSLRSDLVRNSTSRPGEFELTTLHRASQQQRPNTTNSKIPHATRTRVRVGAFRFIQNGADRPNNVQPLVYLLNSTSLTSSNWPEADQKMITYKPTPSSLSEPLQAPYWQYLPLGSLLSNVAGTEFAPEHQQRQGSAHFQSGLTSSADNLVRNLMSAYNRGEDLAQSYEMPYESGLASSRYLRANHLAEGNNNLLLTDPQIARDHRIVSHQRPFVRGPFELDQLQATASSLQNKKIQNNSDNNIDDDDKPTLKHEGNKRKRPPNNSLASAPNDDEPPDYEPSDDFGDGFESISGLNDTVNDDDKHETRPSHSTRDIGGSSISIIKQHFRENSVTPGSATAEAEEGSRANKTSVDDPNASSPQVSLDSTTPVRTASQTGKQPKWKQQQQQPQPAQQQSPGIAGKNELLVGPFKSEAEAPATITLAGVVFQKSGSSSALIRATPSGQLRIASQSSTQRPSAKHEIDGISTSGSASISSSSANQLGALGDWPASLVQQAIAAQQQPVSTVYLGSLDTSSGHAHSELEALAALKALNFKHTPTASAPELSSGSSGSNVIKFNSIAAPIRNQLMLAALAGGNGAPPPNGNELSLSSSNTKLESIALNQQLGNQAKDNARPSKELIIASAGSLAAGGLLSDRMPQSVVSGALALQSESPSQQQVADSSRNLLGQLTGQAQHGAQLHPQRLPNGSLIWTLNKPAKAASMVPSITSGSGGGAGGPNSHLSNFNLQTNDGTSMLEVATANQLTSESKHHHDHKGGPIVIVQKDVKPVKYHLLRAYLKLRRLLRPFEATYVFPNEPAARALRRNQARRWWGARALGGNGAGAGGPQSRGPFGLFSGEPDHLERR